MPRPLLPSLAGAGIPRLMRFAITGLAGLGIDFGTLVALHGGFTWPLVPATATAYVVGGAVHYALTRLWVFPHESRGGELGKVVRYVLLAGTNIVITVVAVVGLVDAGLDYRVAKLCVVVVLFFSNYVLLPRLVLPEARRGPAPAERLND